MSGPCLSVEALAELVRGAGSEDDQRHAAGCPTCTRRLSLLRRVDAAGAAPIVDAVAEVDHLIAGLLTAPRATWWKLLLEPEYRRTDLVRRFLALGMDARFRDRPLSIAFAEAATIVADKLAVVDHTTADLRYEAWKLLSTLLREVGRYRETEAALVEATEAAAATSDPELAGAGVLFARALFAAEPDVWNPEEAASLLDRAESIFIRRNVTTRLYALRTARGALLSRRGDLDAARQTFAALLAATSEDDRENYLDALANLTCVRVELCETGPKLERVIAFLIEENASLARVVATARARWMMGRVLAGRGEHNAAIESLRSAMADIGDSDSVVRIGLEMLQALLCAGRETEGTSLLAELASTAVVLEEREPSRRHHAYSSTVAVSSRRAAP